MNKNTTIGLKALLIAAGMMLSILTLDAQVQKGVDIDGEAAEDRSGFSVSMPDANTIAIGAYRNDGGGTDAGHVRVYTWNGNAWVQKGVDIDGEAAEDESGHSVSMPDANTLAIGAPWNSDNGNAAGHVRVYTWSGSAWVQKGADIDGADTLDKSGHSVSMPDANTLAIGAPYNSDNLYAAGHVRVYTWSGSAWVQKGVGIVGEAESDNSGWAVSMPDANTVAIGTPYNNGGGTDAGHVRVYTWSGTAWVQKGVDIDGEAADDYSGMSVSMPDANTLAIGAPYNSGNGNFAGHVRVYTWSGTAWVQKGVDIDGEAAQDNSGMCVSMPDANTVAIGAPLNQGSGNYRGQVRVYTWSGTAWVKKGLDIEGEADNNGFGRSVSMPNTNTLAIGAPGNSGGGPASGHVRVYTFTTIDVSENSLPSLLNLYPNPTSNILNVEVGSEYLNSAYSIFDNTGRVVLTGTLHSEVTSIQLGDLPSGVYTISVGDCKRQTFKVSRG